MPWQSLYHRLFDTIRQGVVYQDATGIIVSMNPAAERILGKTRAEFLGQSSVSVEHDTLREDGSPFPGLEHPAMVALRTGREVRDVLMQVYNPRERQYRWISITAMPLFHEGESTPYQVYTIFDDVTERRAAEARLRETQQLTEALNRINETIHASLNTEEILQCLVNEGAAALGCDTAVVSVRKDGLWTIPHVYGPLTSLVGTRKKDDEKQLALLALRTRQPLAIADTFDDPQVNPEYARQHNIRAVLVAPLIVRDELFGAIFFSYHSGPHPFSQAQVQFAGQLAATAAIALENGRLFDERLKSEQELKKNREWLRVTLTSIGDGVIATDVQGRVTFLNSVAATLTGWQQDEAWGRPIGDVFSIINEQTRQPAEDVVGRVLREGRVLALANSTALVTKDGREVPIEDSAAPILDADANVAGVVLVFHDVKEKRRVLKALRESEERFRTIYDTAPAAIWQEDWTAVIEAIDRVRAQGVTDFAAYFQEHPGFVAEMLQAVQMVDVNQGTVDVLEARHKAEVLASLDTVFATPDTLPGFVAELTALATGQQVFRTEMAVNTVRGDTRQVLLAMAFPSTGSGSGKVLGSMIDITERKQAEQALQESEERLKRAQEIAHLGSWELDVVNNRLTWSDEVYRIFGLEPQEFGATYEAFLACVHPDDCAAVDAAYSDSLRQDRDEYEIEHRVVRQDSGEIRVVHERCEHVRDATGKVVRSIGMVHDITERKRDEEQITSLAKFPGENPNPTLRLSGGGTILYANGSGRALLEEWNRKVGEIVPQDWQQTVQEALRTKDEKIQDFRCGESIYLVAAVPISEGGYVNLYARDVTKERESQIALQQAHDELELRVKERTGQLLETNVQLRTEIEERTRTEQALRLEEARLDALLRLSQISEASLSELAGFVLEQGIALTQSKIGFVGFLSEDESIYTINAVSTDVVKECDLAGDPVQWHIAEAGIWADAIRERKTLFINDYSQPDPRKKGLPPGHPYIQKFMIVPILKDERVVAVGGVGNKVVDYDQSDERQIALLLDGMWKYVQRDRAGKALEEAYNELRASEERFRQLAENIREVFWLVEPDTWHVLYVSPAYDAIWGRSRQELYEQPQSFFDTIHPDDREQAVQDFTANWQDCDREFRILRPDGTLRWIRLRSFPVYSDKGEIYRLAGVAVDRTEQKASEAALVHAERLSVAGKLAASLGHEINNPLQAVIGCLGLAQGALEKGTDPGAYLQVAYQEVRRTAQIVSQLRSLGRPAGDVPKVPTDLNNLLSDVLVLNKKHLETNNIEVIWEPDSRVPSLYLVPDSMRQVFLNLVLNAAEAMPQGGQLRLSTACTDSPAGVRVIVSDTGTGIPPEVLPHIFDAFYSTKSEGLGVGLHISQNIVQQHGGRIEVQSPALPLGQPSIAGQAGGGTTFTIWLPRQEAALSE